MLSGQWVTRGHVSTQSHRATQVIWTPRVPDASHWKFRLLPGCPLASVLGEHTQTHIHYRWNASLSIPFPTGA